jgi:hypothetical protein
MPDTTAADAATETRVSADMATREGSLVPSSWDPEQRTIDVTFTTGARGARFSWSRWETIDEELSTEARAVRLDRINRGGPVLNVHRSYELDNQLGVVVPSSARMANGEGIATLKLSERDNIAGIVADIAAGIIRNVSVGYIVHSYEITENEGQRALYRAVDWEPYEISFVPMPFDAAAQVRSAEPAQGGHPCIIRRALPASTQERHMPQTPEQTGETSVEPTTRTTNETTTAAPPVGEQRQQEPAAVTGADVRTAARNAGLDADATLDLLERHATTPMTRDALMADIGRRFAERDAPTTTTNRITVSRDAGDTMMRGMGDALSHRFGPGSELTDVGRQFRGMGLLRMAEELLVARGVSVRGLSSHEIAERSLHSTSDFPALVGGALNRRLRASYEENRPTYRIWARRAPNAPDFKTIDVVQMSAMPDLSPVGEGGEFKYGTASDGKVSYKMATYGKIIGFTRQMIVNDDLRALDRVISGFAGSAARLENRITYGLLAANANMPDGTPLFDAAHGNLAGAGAHVDLTSLKASRGRMRLQKGLQKEELNLAPRYLLVPTTEEQAAYQYTSANYVPAKQTDVNEFRTGGRTAVEPIVDAVMDSLTGTAWFTVADSNQCDTIEYCYLDGAEGVQMSSRMGFTVDGVEFKASLDFAAAAIDSRGMDKNPGTA